MEDKAITEWVESLHLNPAQMAGATSLVLGASVGFSIGHDGLKAGTIVAAVSFPALYLLGKYKEFITSSNAPSENAIDSPEHQGTVAQKKERDMHTHSS